jgi:hypothetical protein
MLGSGFIREIGGKTASYDDFDRPPHLEESGKKFAAGSGASIGSNGIRTLEELDDVFRRRNLEQQAPLERARSGDGA